MIPGINDSWIIQMFIRNINKCALIHSCWRNIIKESIPLFKPAYLIDVQMNIRSVSSNTLAEAVQVHGLCRKICIIYSSKASDLCDTCEVYIWTEKWNGVENFSDIISFLKFYIQISYLPILKYITERFQ